MKYSTLFASLSALTTLTSVVFAAPGGPVFYGDAPDEHHPWAVHDRNRPQPKVVTPGTFSTPEQPGKPPSDAVVLFDGTDLSKWESAKDGSPAKWIVKDGYMEVASGDIQTKAKFGDCQLHVEWAAPKEVKGESQGRGNSGVFLMGLCEIQVLDCYNNLTYADGYAGSVYGVFPAMANPLRGPGEFQVYDIVFRRPIYKDGKALDPGHVTIFINGVLVQESTPLEGATGHMGRSKPGPYPDKGVLKLQDHGNPMHFRNIWYRELPPRAIDGGTDGYLTTEATMAKRKEIATTIRSDADTIQNSKDQMLRLMESLVYEKDPAVTEKVTKMASEYVDGLAKLPADQLKTKKDEVKYINGTFKYMTRFNLLPSPFAPAAQTEKMIKDNGWDKR